MGVAVDLAWEDVSVRLGSTVAVDCARLAVEPGEHVAVTGPNGAGKSTLLRAALGLVCFDGTVTVDGRTGTDRSGWRVRRRAVAYVPQRPATGRFPLLVRELLASSGDLDAAIAAAGHLGVDHLLERPLSTLSGGQLQRSYLARAIGHLGAGAGALVADEPTWALDFEGRDLVADVLADLDTTLVVVTHDRTVADRATRIVEMAAGQLRAATP